MGEIDQQWGQQQQKILVSRILLKLLTINKQHLKNTGNQKNGQKSYTQNK